MDHFPLSPSPSRFARSRACPIRANCYPWVERHGSCCRIGDCDEESDISALFHGGRGVRRASRPPLVNPRKSKLTSVFVQKDHGKRSKLYTLRDRPKASQQRNGNGRSHNVPSPSDWPHLDLEVNVCGKGEPNKREGWGNGPHPFAQTRLNGRVSGRVGLALCIPTCKAGCQWTRNELHLYVVRWQERRAFVRRSCPF